MKTQILNTLGSFTLGTGVALVGLLSWTGTTDLQAIKDSVQEFEMKASMESSALVEQYSVTVDNANAEIGAYQDALAQANDNISTLVGAYQQAEQDHQAELEQLQQQADQDLADLQAELDNMLARLDSQYETDMNAIIEQANAEIDKANQEVAQTKDEVENTIRFSSITIQSPQDKIAETGKVLDTTGSKEVTDISSIVPQE